jgi:endo-1,4-beta-xylanase
MEQLIKTDRVEKIDLAEGVFLRHYGLATLSESLGGQTGEPPDRRRPVVVCPGGGYRLIGETEAWPVAERFALHGFYPFILNYTVSEGPLPFDVKHPEEFGPIRDIAAALAAVKDMGDQLSLSDGTVLCGFSAGAHSALSYCAIHGSESIVPEALILAYPYIRYPVFERAGLDIPERVNSDFPPTFMWHGQNDHMINPKGSFQLASRLLAEGVTFEFHCFSDIRHADPFYEPVWFDLMLSWLDGQERIPVSA